jgi:Zn finger protein HypA/HybF involved in hydrogenase expression
MSRDLFVYTCFDCLGGFNTYRCAYKCPDCGGLNIEIQETHLDTSHEYVGLR